MIRENSARRYCRFGLNVLRTVDTEGLTDMNAIIVENVDVFLSKKMILNNISFYVSRGEIVGLIGPSGAGKTTVVKMITGTIKKKRGSIEVMGSKLVDNNVLKQLGYMAQRDALYDDLNSSDHLQFFGGLYGVQPKELKTRISEILHLVDLDTESRKPIHQYSGGMKRRLSLAIALINDPTLLVIDEPTVGLDPLLRRKFWKEFVRMRDRGKSLLITTHAMDEAAACDKLVFIYKGEIIAFETPSALLTSSNSNSIEAAFIYFITKAEGIN